MAFMPAEMHHIRGVYIFLRPSYLRGDLRGCVANKKDLVRCPDKTDCDSATPSDRIVYAGGA
jgi:hypothetical protein